MLKREDLYVARAGGGLLMALRLGLGVGQIPTICIDGEVKFPSIIPDINTLIDAITERLDHRRAIGGTGQK